MDVSGASVNAFVAEAVGENIDALITLDLRGYHVGRILYRAARKQAGKPLSLAAAQAVIDAASPNQTVFLLTGFPFLPYGKPELDGAVGTAVVARALDLALAVRPVVVTDPVTVPAMKSLLTTAGLNLYDEPQDLRTYPHSAAVIPFTLNQQEAEEQAKALVSTFDPGAMVAIEKPGRTANGTYQQGNGADVSHLVSKTDELFMVAQAKGITTVAVGDVGNELGLGSLVTVVDSETPFASSFLPAESGGLAAVVPADHVITAAVSDWGAYGLAAMIAFLTGVRKALHTGSLQRQLLWTAVRTGLLDGSGRGEPSVDGVGEDFTARLVTMMGEMLDIIAEQSQKYRGIIDRLGTLPFREGHA